MHAEAHTYTPSARMAALDVYLGRVFSRRAHYVRLSRLSLGVYVYVHVYLFASARSVCMYLRHGF
jgi:hypothetical protein